MSCAADVWMVRPSLERAERQQSTSNLQTRYALAQRKQMQITGM
jgi:hypothetical protein